VTGLGPVCPFGLGIEALATALWDKPNRLRELTIGKPEGPQAAVQRVPPFDLNSHVKARRPYVDPHSAFALAAGSLALAPSGRPPQELDPSASGLATGTVFGNAASLEIFQQSVRGKGMRLASPVLFQHCYPNTTNSLMSIEFGLRGFNQNFCGDPLCGGRAIQAGHEAVRAGMADLMLAGGCDALSERLSIALRRECGRDGPILSEGACFLALESEQSVRRRGGKGVCELVCVVSAGTGLAARSGRAEDQMRIGAAIRSAITRALSQTNLWEGDLGALFLAMPWSRNDPLCQAAKPTLDSFSQLPTFTADEVGGYAFAATFPLQCAAAALLLNQRMVPSPMKLEKVERGVELWVEQPPASMLGTAALVLGWSAHSVVAAILKA